MEWQQNSYNSIYVNFLVRNSQKISLVTNLKAFPVQNIVHMTIRALGFCGTVALFYGTQYRYPSPKVSAHLFLVYPLSQGSLWLWKEMSRICSKEFSQIHGIHNPKYPVEPIACFHDMILKVFTELEV